VLINAVHPAYGEPADLAAFVDMAHRTGIAVILDVVHNHLGPSGNNWDRFGPFFTDQHHTPWGKAVNLDGRGSDDVRRILLDSALAWLRDYHLDGLRLDAVHELHDSRATSFLEELATEVATLSLELQRPLTLVAESDRNDPRTVTDREHGGLGLSAQWDDDVHHALHWLLTGESNGYYADFASRDAVSHTVINTFLHDGRFSSFRGRTHGRRVDPCLTPPDRFVAALQNHDQIGNRARGERLSQLVSLDRAAAGAALLFALPYIPMLFMGEEWAAQTPWQFFSAFEDEALARSVTEGRRLEFAAHGWGADEVPDPQDPATFRASVLDWSEPGTQDGLRMLSWYRQLAGLRRTRRPATGRPSVHWDPTADSRPAWCALLVDDWATCVNLTDDTALTVTIIPAPGHRVCIEASWSRAPDIVDMTDPDLHRLVLAPGSTVLISGVETLDAAPGSPRRS
jgi:maltooligosyltrehalose trehalohydrolase